MQVYILLVKFLSDERDRKFSFELASSSADKSLAMQAWQPSVSRTHRKVGKENLLDRVVL